MSFVQQIVTYLGFTDTFIGELIAGLIFLFGVSTIIGVFYKFLSKLF